MEPRKNQNLFTKPLTFIGLLIVIGGLIGYINVNKRLEKAETETSNGIAVGSSTEQNTTASSGSTYDNGTYSAMGNYISPGGNQKIGVTLTLKDGIVVAADLNEMASDPTSKQYQDIFASDYKQFVIGKNIDDLKLSVVSGSSLTSRGFNLAVASIREQAKS